MLLVKTLPFRAGITVFCTSGTLYSHKYVGYPVARQVGRNNDQPHITKPLVVRGLVPYTLMFLKVEPYWKHLIEMIARQSMQTA